MEIVRVTYTTKVEFSEQNKSNIKIVMKDLRNERYQGINYQVCLSVDNTAFIHTAFFQSDADRKLLSALPSFQFFQEQIKAGPLAVQPKQEYFTLIGSSKNIF
ncbi:MAG: hypothetical protein ACK4IY_03025 [Chitinophagales bacterium]